MRVDERRNPITSARRRLWMLTFVIMAALAAVSAYLAVANEDGGRIRPSYLPSPRLLAIGLAGVLVAFALYVVDSERKIRRLAASLEREHREAERMREEETEQREFVSMVAHELRSPLTAIKGYTRTMMTKFEQLAPERRAQYLATVNDQADRLARLVDDLMEVSRIDARNLKLRLEIVDTAEVVDGLVAQYRTKTADRSIEVERNGTAKVSADRHRLEGILINLIDNAIKYSPAGSAVRVAVHRTGEDVEVAVRDHGAGISLEEQATLFQKFQRLPSTASGDIPGTGLGLFIVKGLVEAHGGRVWVRSAPGDGSTFGFTLPAA